MVFRTLRAKKKILGKVPGCIFEIEYSCCKKSQAKQEKIIIMAMLT